MAEAPPAAKEEALSPAKARIQAAKEATVAKAAKGGYSGGIEGEAKAFSLDLPGGGNKDPFAEADELAEKIRELKEQASLKGLSKSKSALLAQYRQMEPIARDKARAEYARQQKAAAKEEAKASGVPMSSASGDGDKSFADSFNKITGVGLPSLPSVPSVPSLPSLPF